MSGKKKFVCDQGSKVQLANGRFAYVTKSPYTEGKIAYRFAERDKKFLGTVPKEDANEQHSQSQPRTETRESEWVGYCPQTKDAI